MFHFAKRVEVSNSNHFMLPFLVGLGFNFMVYKGFLNQVNLRLNTKEKQISATDLIYSRTYL